MKKCMRKKSGILLQNIVCARDENVYCDPAFVLDSTLYVIVAIKKKFAKRFKQRGLYFRLINFVIAGVQSRESRNCDLIARNGSWQN